MLAEILTEFEEGILPKEFSPELIDYMEKTAQEMEINYMKIGLSKEEEFFQRNQSLQVVFFYMKYLPHFLNKYGLHYL